ncbi:hypothetical protein H4R20_004078 [Coemansia guatemalensis]|uniref:C2H2-type domain-containing protein n=1 Tax=Coemansia guatemalensis TaxID=2761395 RepID=A0A9W8HSN5_9FUNG|nr:hypothetical protein H4R20_004078 [Coemansia guatemalensis]
MTSYSFSTASAALMDTALENPKGSSATGAAGAGNAPYGGTHIYRHDSAIASGPYYNGSPGQPPQQQQQSSAQRSMVESHATNTTKNSINAQASLAGALSSVDTHSVGSNALADYLFKQQVMSIGTHQDGSAKDTERQQQQQTSTDISSMVAAVAAATAASSTTSSLAYAQRQYGYDAKPLGHNTVLTGNAQSPSASAAGLPGTALIMSTTPPTDASTATAAHSSAGLTDPLPTFLSSLPMQESIGSPRYSTIAAKMPAAQCSATSINNTSYESSGVGDGANGEYSVSNRRETPSNGILAAAAAAAASVVRGTSGTEPDGALHSSISGSNVASLDTSSGVNQQQYSSYSRHPYSGASHGLHQQQQQENSAYTVDGLTFSHMSSSTATLAPSLSEQSAADISGAAVAAALANGDSNSAVASGIGSSTNTNPPDLNSYSISAFSRPLGQSNSTTSVFLGNETSGSGYASNGGSTNTPGLVGSISGVCPPSQQQQQQLQSHYYQQQQPQQQRSYGDYSSYYRASSTALGVGTTAANTSAAGASPMSGTGIGNSSVSASNISGSTQLSAAAAAAAAAAMGSAYYTPTTYQQYMRTGIGAPGAASAAYSYYYSQPSSRYLPYAAYPPVRHFVSPARPFKCETCEQSFSRNHDLKRHVKIHSGIKPHKCLKCGKSFGRSDALKRHSLVKRCRSSTTSATTASSSASGSGAAGTNSSQRHHPHANVSQHHDSSVARALHQQSVGSAALTTVAGNSRLAPVSALFGQNAATSMATSSGSIVSNMLASRTNSI